MKKGKFDTFQLASGLNYILLPEELFFNSCSVTSLNLLAWGLEVSNEKAFEALETVYTSIQKVQLKENFCVAFREKSEAERFVKMINDLLKQKIKDII